MLPFFVMMAVLYGALNAALDTTAGERERGSLEPLLMNPAERWALVAGKWGAVACVSMLIAVLSSLQLPAGAVGAAQRHAGGDVPVRAARGAALHRRCCCRSPRRLSAVLMAVAIRSRTFKEAQASSTIVVLAVSLLPLVNVFNLGGEAPWQLWVPALAQNTLMTRVLKGEAFGWPQVVDPAAACASR